MTEPAYQDRWLTVYGGDMREVLAGLPADSVDCVVTSPPYWSLRDYGIAPSVWGGEPGHDHQWEAQARAGAAYSTKTRWHHVGPEALREMDPGSGGHHENPAGSRCACGAWLGALGLEPRPEEYVAHLVEAFEAVRRVLKPSGTVWLNLGDSYWSVGGPALPPRAERGVRQEQVDPGKWGRWNRSSGWGLKVKDLVGVPWRSALALQEAGWWLRSDIVWAKPNPLPESTDDRPTKAHEYVFLLSKAARYYYDSEAVREPMSDASRRRIAQATFGSQTGGEKDYANGTNRNRSARKALENFAEASDGGRNLRSWWPIPTVSYPGAHFATFAPRLVEPCVKAGTSERGVCPECGRPWRRAMARPCEECGAAVPRQAKSCAACGHVRDWRAGRETSAEYGTDWSSPGRGAPRKTGASGKQGSVPPQGRLDLGWEPSCAHGADALAPDDLDLIASPTTDGGLGDPSAEVGRAGMARPRRPDEGQRTMTRWQQRRYAGQLRSSRHRADMEAEAGPAFAHYVRTDAAGGRAVPQALLASWVARGWITEVPPPRADAPEPVPAVVLDPFAGTGTTGLVAQALGRRAILVDANPDYLQQSLRRASREFGVGGPALADDGGAEVPEDSIWAGAT